MSVTLQQVQELDRMFTSAKVRDEFESLFWNSLSPLREGGVLSHAGSPIPGEWIVPGRMLSPDRQATAAEIHAALDTVADEEIARAERILEYRRLYPSNPFLTKDQVQALCLKYDLVMAPDFMFAGNVPEKNRAERAAFHLQEKHRLMDIGDDDLAARFFARSTRERYGEATLDTEVRMPENPDAAWALVVSSDIALLCPKGFMSLRRLAEMSNGYYLFDTSIFDDIVPVVRTRKGFVRLSEHLVSKIHLEIRRDDVTLVWGSRAAKAETVVRCQFSIPDLCGRQIFSYEEDVCQMVVCPPNMLEQNIPMQINNGWECIFSRSQAAPRGRGADPIILQPVEDGYLVVTKWDAEASLPEVAGQTN